MSLSLLLPVSDGQHTSPEMALTIHLLHSDWQPPAFQLKAPLLEVLPGGRTSLGENWGPERSVPWTLDCPAAAFLWKRFDGCPKGSDLLFQTCVSSHLHPSHSYANKSSSESLLGGNRSFTASFGMEC